MFYMMCSNVLKLFEIKVVTFYISLEQDNKFIGTRIKQNVTSNDLM